MTDLFRDGHSLGWQQVVRGRARGTVTPLMCCGCRMLACGGAMTGPDGLCEPCRRVASDALDASDAALAHVGGVRPGTQEPTPHVTTLETAMRLP